jgi:flagellar basal-body rod protein FlgB
VSLLVGRLFGGAVEPLVRGLGFAARRHEVLAENLANLETPGYRARDLVFEDVFRSLLDSSAEPAPLRTPVAEPAPAARLVYTRDRAPRPSGNDVDLHGQLARLAENSLFHQALAQVLAHRFAALKQAISGRV